MNNKKLSIVVAAVLAGFSMAHVRSAVAEPAQGQQQIQSKLTGKLAVTVIERDGDGYRVRAELQSPSYEQSPSPADDVAPLLTQPFYFTIMPNGELRSFYFAKGLATDARLLLRQLATSMQAVLPSAPAASWSTTEQDQSGQYLAAYSADGSSITRTKTKYLHTAGLGGALPAPAGMDMSVQSRTDYELAPDGWAQRIASNESYDAHFGNAEISVATRTTLSLAERVARPDLVGAMPAGVEAEDVAEARSAAEAAREQDMKAVAGRTVEELIEQLQSPVKKTSDDAMAALSADFRINPGDLLKAEKAALRGLKGNTAPHRLVYAIGRADTTESQATLVSLLRSNDVDRQLDAVVTLGLLPKPAATSADAVIEALDAREPRVAHAALLAVGNMAKRTAAVDTANPLNEKLQLPGSERLVGVVLKHLDSARDDFERKLAIEALGNSGHAQILTAVQPFLSDKNPQLRVAALEALRFLKGAAADQAIVAALGDSDDSVRLAAAKTIATRPVVGVLPALTQLMTTEQNKDVAFAVVHGLNGKRSETPGVDTLLQSIAASQPRAEVKELAKQVLATN